MAFFAGSPVWGLELTATQERAVARGEIITQYAAGDDPLRSATSVGRIPFSARNVYLLATDFKNYPRIFNGLEAAAIESQEGRTVVGTFTTRVPWPLPPRAVRTVTRLDPARMRFDWRRVDGSIRAYEGVLEAVPEGPDACVVHYQCRIDPGFEWLPTWFVAWAQTRVLPSVVTALRDTLTFHHGPYWAAGVSHPEFEGLDER